ncbi:MAG TPA: electron transfer flavoprotein subunit alpha/FixB family protein, partial [Bryobacteraceae bacterium]|nr:electron transfer flavoprotein subunit alpha/FixB family protein [Bryobacteraceae bacterium]
MSSVLAILEATGGSLHRMSPEALTAAQQLAAAQGLAVTAVLPGDESGELSQQTASARIEKVLTLRHNLLRQYTADAWVEALSRVITSLKPRYVVLPHTYQVRDFAPRLATRFGQVLISDVVEFREGKPVRQLFQGKLNADIDISGNGPI